MTRRQVLKLLAGAALAPVLGGRGSAPVSEDEGWVRMGRAIHAVRFYKRADAASERVAVRYRDQAFRILGEVHAPYTAHNDLWYRTELGYVHSAWVLPMRIYPRQPFIADVGPWGFWGEIAQVYTEARSAPSSKAARPYRFYGGTVFHVIDAARDEAGNGWYKVVDDYPPRVQGNHQWVLAQDVRRIPRQELAPIRPFVGRKRIEIDLAAQTLQCFEGDEPVFSTLIASGVGGDLATPVGEHCVLLKQPSRHMSNVPYDDMPEGDQPAPGDIFDLPGVPWNVFFDLSGTAIHGVYWHNDFGIRRSHGCVNVSCAAARFVYRWVHPVGGYEDDFIQSTCRVGTPILIR
jgi:lipoprotein-anchoring transpeptidase ErfK/SrfK